MPPALGCRALAAVLLPLVLAGCSGTRFGQALSRSFSGTPATPAAGSGPPATAPASGSAPPSPASGGAQPSAPGASPAPGTARAKVPLEPRTPAPGRPGASAPASAAGTASPSTAAAAGSTAAAPVPRRPAPYRVTILLPQADASAPAEVVTQALRAAGVPFEVETIERIGAGSSQASPGASQPSPQPATTVRPAPALR